MVDWGGALKDTRTRLQGWTGVFFPTPGCWVLMSGVDGGDLWLQLSACTIAKAMRHDLQSSKSPGRATAQPGTAWVLWELREVGRGSDEPGEQATEDSLPTWHLRKPMVCLKADERRYPTDLQEGLWDKPDGRISVDQCLFFQLTKTRNTHWVLGMEIAWSGASGPRCGSLGLNQNLHITLGKLLNFIKPSFLISKTVSVVVLIS